MRWKTLGVFVAGFALFMAAAPLLAHHSGFTIYDQNKTITLMGTVKKVDWVNPHIIWYLNVTDESGKVITWSVEGGAPSSLHRAGWRKEHLKIGESVRVEGFMTRRAGTNHINGRNITFSDGRKVFGGSNDGLPVIP